ncbi:MAG TPA: Hpt domain-containing protein [Gemmatimonadaceae bacterium]
MTDFDASAIDQLRPYGAALVAQMIDLFLDTVPPRIDAARAAAGAGDHEGVREAMHSAKAAAGQVGAVALQRSCTAAEAAARARVPAEELQALVGHAARDMERAVEWLGTARGREG